MSLFNTNLRLNVPFVMVIFGVSGDLTRRKLVPALFELYRGGYLPERFTILGYARRDWEASDMVAEIETFLKDKPDTDQAKLKQFFAHFDYLRGDFDKPTDYDGLAAKLKQLDDSIGQCGRRLFYLATPAESYLKILDGIKRTKLQEACGEDQSWTRVVVEKPFGRDLVSAKALDKELTMIFAENQIYRIDHYLAKETAQNIMMFRFANAIFEPLWSSSYIERIEIIIHESIGVGTRGNFYDATGALRDMVQNHLLQLLTLVTMEQPSANTAKAFRDARFKLLNSIGCMDLDHLGRNLVLGQYAGYRAEPNVGKDSVTETFVAVLAEIDLPRWRGVPVVLVAGKKMASTMTRIRVAFKNVPKNLFQGSVGLGSHNVLTFDIQPTEGIGLQLLAKQPGYGSEIAPVTMHFNYRDDFNEQSIDAYTRLLLDTVDGDQTLFTRSDEVEAEWRFIDPILTRLGEWGLKPKVYADGSLGPEEADRLLKQG